MNDKDSLPWVLVQYWFLLLRVAFSTCLSNCDTDMGVACALCVLRHSQAMTSGIFKPQRTQAVSNASPVYNTGISRLLLSVCYPVCHSESLDVTLCSSRSYSAPGSDGMWCCSPAVLPWAAVIGETASKPLFVPLQLHKVHLHFGKIPYLFLLHLGKARHDTHGCSSSAVVSDWQRTQQPKPNTIDSFVLQGVLCDPFLLFSYLSYWVSALCYRFNPQRSLYKFTESGFVSLLNCNRGVFSCQ